jgi:hypothetical protein
MSTAVMGGGRFVWKGGDKKKCPYICNLQVEEMNECTPIGTVYPAGDYTFTWESIELANIDDFTIEITDLNTGIILATGLSKVSPAIVNIPYDITMATPGTYEFSITAMGVCGPVTVTGNLIIEFCIIRRIYHEGSSNPALTAAEIPTELNNTETNKYPGTYKAYGAGYKYIAVPQSLMETDGTNPRPTQIFQPPKLRSDVAHIDITMIEYDTATTFNPMIAMEPPYTVTLHGETYYVFRSTYKMGEKKHITLFDWN